MCPTGGGDPALWTERVVSGRYYYEAEAPPPPPGTPAQAGTTAQGGASAPDGTTGQGGTPAAGASGDAGLPVLDHGLGNVTVGGVRPDDWTRVVLNLDVDGWFFLGEASATMTRADGKQAHWAAKLKGGGERHWKGQATRDHGDDIFPPCEVAMSATQDAQTGEWSLTLDMIQVTGLSQRLTLVKRYDHFHPFEVQCDRTDEQEPAFTSVLTAEHPDHPASQDVYPLVGEELDIAEAYRRVGFAVTFEPPGDPIPDDCAHDQLWSDDELHNAMEAYWEPGGGPYEEAPRWAMWLLFTGSNEFPNALGVMFDAIGDAQRQGAAIFLKGFNVYEQDIIRSGDAAHAASARRRRQYFSCVHELGHGLNMAHCWQDQAGSPWRDIGSDPEARSFMNYPYLVAGKEPAFFKTFAYRFRDGELEFLRHAPEEFVKTGTACWYDEQGMAPSAPPPLFDRMDLRIDTGRPGDRFAFLEPVFLQVELRNRGPGAMEIDAGDLTSAGRLTLVIKRQGAPARLYQPPMRMLSLPVQIGTGESAFGSVFAGASPRHWLVDEPGAYTVRACLHLESGNVLSEPRIFHVQRGSPAMERLAADWFSLEVSRALSLGGCRSPRLARARRVFEDVLDTHPDSPLVLHARDLLASGLGRRYKTLVRVSPRGQGGRPAWRIERLEAEPDRERSEKRAVLLDPRAPDALGFATFALRVRRHARWLGVKGLASESEEFEELLRTEASRRGATAQLSFLDRHWRERGSG